jgi:hypothetical protein
MGNKHALGEASRVIGIGDLALAIKTAVHDYVEMVERCQEEEEETKKMRNRMINCRLKSTPAMPKH